MKHTITVKFSHWNPVTRGNLTSDGIGKIVTVGFAKRPTSPMTSRAVKAARLFAQADGKAVGMECSYVHNSEPKNADVKTA